MAYASIRPLLPDDFESWLTLWNANNQGHAKDDVTAETWRRINDPSSSVHGLGAFVDGKMAGFVHYITHPVTGHIAPACYMQDLFVNTAFRRQGIARALVEALAKEAKAQNYARLYWLAETKNDAAQRLYKSLGLKLDFSFHVLPL